MKLYKVSLLTALSCFVSGCISDAFWGNPVYEKKLNGGYYLDAADTYEEMAISVLYGEEGIGTIRPIVFAVGQNENFIIVKQHPLNSPGVINKKITNYYIIPLNFKISKSPDSNYFGPLTVEKFEQKRKELNMPHIQFTIIFKELI